MPADGLPLSIGMLVVALPMLYLGAEWLVRGSASLARAAHIRPMVIGLTVVAFATSAPELVVGLVANLTGAPDVAVGDVIGANVANIGLIIGASALVSPLLVQRSTWRREVPITILVQLVLFVFVLNGDLSRFEGAVLLLILATFIVYSVQTAKEVTAADAELPPELVKTPVKPTRDVTLVVLGVAVLASGGYLLVSGATALAAAAGVTQLTVGATLVALLTTAPELATSIIAARRKEGDIAVGNAVGSCLFNTACVLGAASTLRPIEGIAPAARYVKLPMMIVLMLVLVPFARTGSRVARWEGAILVACYLGFAAYVIATGGAH